MTASDRIFEQLLKTGLVEVRLTLTDYESIKELLLYRWRIFAARTTETIYLDKHIVSSYSPSTTVATFGLQSSKR